MLAHRLAFEHWNTPLLTGDVVMHTCDNPACCNPLHLKSGTQRQNLQDMAQKGRWGNAGHKGEQVGTSKLTESDVISIREAYIANERIDAIMTRFCVSRPTVKRIISGATWSHLFGVAGPSKEQLLSARRCSGWLPPSEAKLNAEKARELKALLSSGTSDVDAAAMFGLSRRYVTDIRNGINWRDA